MANFFSRFKKRWSATGVISEPTDNQADTGFSYLGVNPPTVELFNAMFQQLDEKDNWLYNRIVEVLAFANITPAEATPNQLFSAIKVVCGRAKYVIGQSQNLILPAFIDRIFVRAWGAGGGGGGAYNSNGAGSGGGGGGYVEGQYAVTPGSSIFITIGQGGAGATAAAIYSAGAGGTTSVGSLCYATGGAAGLGGDNTITGAAPVPGGMGVGGNMNLQGISGGYGQGYKGTAYGGGIGGASPFGGGLSHLSIGASGNPGQFPGGGGCGGGSGGAVGSSWGGGRGADGYVEIQF